MKSKLMILGLLVSQLGFAQQFSEKITKEFTFEKTSSDNALLISNISGDVKVVGYEGTKIQVEVTKSIFAKTDARLEKGKQELNLGVIDRADTIILYTQQGCNEFGYRLKNRNNGWRQSGWGYDWNCRDKDCRPEYDYKLDFTVKVPYGIHLVLSTVNDGDIEVENVRGAVDANNVNGSIRLTNLVREADASTINGDVDVTYTTNPSKDCRFYSLNGDINAMFQKGLGASVSFESFNGSFYTNIDALEPLPTKVVKMDKEGDGIKYKVNGNRYQIGKGGTAFLDFETFNGNVYLKERSN
jgi:hypothetical protein